jgi:hypothetical protein
VRTGRDARRLKSLTITLPRALRPVRITADGRRVAGRVHGRRIALRLHRASHVVLRFGQRVPHGRLVVRGIRASGDTSTVRVRAR